jgi:hypothetical protein
MKKILTITAIALCITGCATQKNWSATGGSRSDGVVRLSYEYGMFEVPKLSDQQGINLAKSRCSAWGYTDAEAFGGVTQVCNKPTGSGCNSFLVTAEYQCLGDLEK